MKLDETRYRDLSRKGTRPHMVPGIGLVKYIGPHKSREGREIWLDVKGKRLVSFDKSSLNKAIPLVFKSIDLDPEQATSMKVRIIEKRHIPEYGMCGLLGINPECETEFLWLLESKSRLLSIPIVVTNNE